MKEYDNGMKTTECGRTGTSAMTLADHTGCDIGSRFSPIRGITSPGEEDIPVLRSVWKGLWSISGENRMRRS